MDTNQTQAITKPPSGMYQTLREDGKYGESIPKDAYDNWSFFILSTLSTAEDITLNDLLEKAYDIASASPGIRNNSKTGWYILQVKRDLEGRGLIKVIPSPSLKHTFLIQLTRQGMSKINYTYQMTDWSEKDM